MTDISDRTINIDDLRGQPGDSEFLGDAVLDVLQDEEGRPQKVMPTALIFHGDVAAWITPPKAEHMHGWETCSSTVAVSFDQAGGLAADCIPQTVALLRCAVCGDVASRILAGIWTLEDLRREGGR